MIFSEIKLKIEKAIELLSIALTFYFKSTGAHYYHLLIIHWEALVVIFIEHQSILTTGVFSPIPFSLKASIQK